MKDYTKVECKECGHKAHFLEVHLTNEHGLTVEEYRDKHPGAQVLSAAAAERLRDIEAQSSKNRLSRQPIKKLFGCNPFKDSENTEVWAFDKPHATTPEVDPDYYFSPDLLAVTLFVMENRGERCLLVGPTGSGKSSIATQVAARLNWPCYRVNFDSDITRGDLVGQYVITGKDEMTFQYGFLPRAMKEGAVLILDEWDCVNPSIGMVLQPVLEGGNLTISENGEIVKPHPNFRIFATSNTVGQGDESGLYNGTTPQNFATLDRYTIVETVDYPKKVVESKIVKKKTGIADEAVLEKLLHTAKLIRESYVKEEIRTTMSTRTVVNVAKKIVAFGDPLRAYKLGYLNKLNTEDQAVCLELVQRVWGF